MVEGQKNFEIFVGVYTSYSLFLTAIFIQVVGHNPLIISTSLKAVRVDLPVVPLQNWSQCWGRH
jgi:hypothetical protein